MKRLHRHVAGDKSPEAPGKLENLKELVRSMDEFETWRGIGTYLAGDGHTTQENDDKVSYDPARRQRAGV